MTPPPGKHRKLQLQLKKKKNHNLQFKASTNKNGFSVGIWDWESGLDPVWWLVFQSYGKVKLSCVQIQLQTLTKAGVFLLHNLTLL